MYKGSTNTALLKEIEHLQFIFSNVQLLISYVDSDLKYRYHGELYLKWFGEKPESTYGKKMHEVLNSTAFKEISPYVSKALAGTKVTYKTMIPNKDKGSRYVNTVYLPNVTDDKEVVGFFALTIDITEVKDTEKKLRDNEERYKAFIKNSKEGVWRFELEKPIPVSLPAKKQIDLMYKHAYMAETNATMAKMYGYKSPRSLIGMRLDTFLPRTDPRSIEYLLAFISEDYGLSGVDSQEKDKHGNDKHFSNSLTGYVENGELLRAWGTQQDITERKIAEEKLNYRTALLEAENEAIPLGIVVVDTKGKILSHNKNFVDLWQTPKHILQSKDDDAALDFAMTQLVDPEGFIARVTYLYENPHEISNEEIHFKDGRVLNRYGVPIIGRDKKYYGWAWYFQDITERKNEDLKLQRQNHYLEVLRETAVVLSQRLRPQKLLKLVLEKAGELVGTSDGYVYQLNKDESKIVVKLGIGTFASYVNSELSKGEGLAGKVWRDNKILAIKDYDTWTGRSKNFPKDVLHAVIGIPLTAGEKVVGVIALAYHKKDKMFTDEQVEALTRLAEITSIALENANLYHELQNEIVERKKAESAAEAGRKQIHGLFMQAPALVAIHSGPNHVFEMANKLYLKSMNKSKNIIGKPAKEVFPELEVQGYFEILDSVYKTGEPYSAEEALVRLDMQGNGALQGGYYNFVVQPVKNGHGAISGIMVHAIDVTAQVTDRRKLQQSEERMRFMAESMPQKIFTAKPNGAIDYFNPQWMEFTGLSFEETKDWGWTQFVHPDDLVENVELWKKSINSGEPFEFEHRFRRHDGEYRWHISRASAHRDESNDIIMWIGSNTDIHDMKLTAERQQVLEKMNVDLTEQREELLALNNAKDEFISLASHQLRTPATGVKQFVGMVLEGYVGKIAVSQREMLEYAYESNERQLQVISDLLKVAQVDAGKVSLSKESCDMVELVKDILQEQQNQFELRKQDVVFKSDNTKHIARVDINRMRMVLENIIDNASKYTPDGKKIEIDLMNIDRNQVHIRIKDQGVGIPAKHMTKLFQKFSRIDNPLSILVGGTGLGLYWAKKIIVLHGGTISVSSKPNKGTVFNVKIPA